MTDEFYTGEWQGYYIYGGTQRRRAGQQVEFKVELTVEDGVLSGQATEEVTETYMGAPAAISGFIEGSMISMIKQYPFYYRTGENGDVQVDRNRQHPPIHYTGYYNEGTRSFSGEWVIGTVGETDFWGNSSIRVSSGTWEMKKRPAE